MTRSFSPVAGRRHDVLLYHHAHRLDVVWYRASVDQSAAHRVGLAPHKGGYMHKVLLEFEMLVFPALTTHLNAFFIPFAGNFLDAVLHDVR